MRIKKIEKYINELFEDKEKYINGAEFWNKTVSTYKKVDRLEEKLAAVESAVNTIWSLPMFREYRGKK